VRVPWNLENKFTDGTIARSVPYEEVLEAGQLIKKEGIKLDVAHTSLVVCDSARCGTRAGRDWFHVIPVQKTWLLNKGITELCKGLDKQETVDKYGKDQVHHLAFSYGMSLPPTVDKKPAASPKQSDPRYADSDF
jgi:2,3-bisphosphoglycerate-dependent phosphoglycerate mutase